MVEKIVNSLCKKLNIRKKDLIRPNGKNAYFLNFNGSKIMKYSLGESTQALHIKPKRKDFLEIDILKDEEGNFLEISVACGDTTGFKKNLGELAEPEKYKTEYRAFISKIQENIVQRMSLGEDPSKAEVIIPYTKKEERFIPVLLYDIIMNKKKLSQTPGPKPFQYKRKKK